MTPLAGVGEGKPLPLLAVYPDCECGHSRATHDIHDKGTRTIPAGTRTGCLHFAGPKGVPCPCRLYKPGEDI